MRLLDKLGGRKLIFVIISLLVGTIVDLKAPGGLSSNLKDLIIALGAMYVCGNVLNKSAEVVKSVKEGKATSPTGMQELIEKVSSIQQGQAEVYQNLSTNTLATGEILKRVNPQFQEPYER